MPETYWVSVPFFKGLAFLKKKKIVKEKEKKSFLFSFFHYIFQLQSPKHSPYSLLLYSLLAEVSPHASPTLHTPLFIWDNHPFSHVLICSVKWMNAWRRIFRIRHNQIYHCPKGSNPQICMCFTAIHVCFSKCRYYTRSCWVGLLGNAEYSARDLDVLSSNTSNTGTTFHVFQSISLILFALITV